MGQKLTDDHLVLIKSGQYTFKELLSLLPTKKSQLHLVISRNGIHLPQSENEFEKYRGVKTWRMTILDVFVKPAKDGVNRTFFRCKCDCGTEKEIRSDHFVSNGVKSCGCLNREVCHGKVLPNNEAMFNDVLRSYKNRNIPFKLTKEEFRKYTKQNCHYCGSIPKKEKTHPHSPSVYTYNGLDRVDNTKGYENENIVSCCEHCN